MSNTVQVYLAFYRGRKKVTDIKSVLFRFTDWVTRISTKGEFSHVEIAVKREDGEFDCYSSSSRDGGVRCKQIDVSGTHWVLVPINAHCHTVQRYYTKTQHQKYDLLGAVASTIPFIELKNRQFCSEWCFNAISGNLEGWRFSPNDLFAISNHLTAIHLIKRD